MIETDTHIYFWGTFLSNWFICNITDGQHTYSSSEAYYMAQKALFFNDTVIFQKIIQSNDPRKQKFLGRKIKGFDTVLWDKHKYDVMIKALTLKFEQNEDLKKQLFETGNKILVEGSPYDNVWGVGLHFSDELILDDRNWKGLNLLGQALMEVRKNFVESSTE